MPFLLLLMFPALEIYLLIKIGAEIGALAVLVWLVGAVIFGVNMLRYLGATAMLAAAREMQTGAAPAQALLEPMVKAIAALLLIIPGFASDLLALLLFIPWFRQLLIKRWLRKLTLKSSFGAAGFSGETYAGNVYEHKGSPRDVNQSAAGGRILEHEPDNKD